MPGAIPVARHVRGGHAERHDVHMKVLLATGEGFSGQCVDFLDAGVGHGEAASRFALAVHHNGGASVPVCGIVRVGEADVEGKVVPAVLVHLRLAYRVETFRRLLVAHPKLRPQTTGPSANRISAEMLEAAVLELPDLEFGLFLVNPDEDRSAKPHALFGEKCADALLVLAQTGRQPGYELRDVLVSYGQRLSQRPLHHNSRSRDRQNSQERACVLRGSQFHGYPPNVPAPPSPGDFMVTIEYGMKRTGRRVS